MSLKQDDAVTNKARIEADSTKWQGTGLEGLVGDKSSYRDPMEKRKAQKSLFPKSE